MENENQEVYYDPHQARSDCNKTTIYCILSIVLLIAAGAITHPYVIENIPGGSLTTSMLNIVIIIAVLLLCVWQAPRPKKERKQENKLMSQYFRNSKGYNS